jgi:hypothetical protein
MKNFITFYFIVLSITLFSFSMKAQTYVAGGIWANTTWTLANSPYIVDSSIVVLPGYILTIEPGVVVKFTDGMGMEIRQAELIAMGTAADHITFTSNNASPTPGIYSGIVLNGGTMASQIGYCNFYYANNAIACGNLPIPIKHCTAMFNYDGIFGTGSLDSCLIKYNTDTGVLGFDSVRNCIITSNYDGMFQCFHIDNCIVDSSSDIGITMNSGAITNSFIRYGNIGVSQGNPVTVYNCMITNNQRGIELKNNLTMTYSTIDSNVVGIYNHPAYAGGQHDYIGDCHIENNLTGIYDWFSTGFAGGGNVFTRNNIDHNDVGIFLHQFTTGIDTFYCNTICYNTSYGFKDGNALTTSCVVHNYWCTADSASTESLIYDVYDDLNSGFVYFMPIDSACAPVITTFVNEADQHKLQFDIFPNPATSKFTISSEQYAITSLTICNLLGEKIYSASGKGLSMNVNSENFRAGIYIVEVSSDKQKMFRKLVIE